MALSETNHANVLVADCDIATRGLLGQTLQKEGYNAIDARSGIDAAKIIGSQVIDLAILNVKLPYVNGINCKRGRLAVWTSGGSFGQRPLVSTICGSGHDRLWVSYRGSLISSVKTPS